MRENLHGWSLGYTYAPNVGERLGKHLYTEQAGQRTNSWTYPKVRHKTSAFAFDGVSVTKVSANPIASGCSVSVFGGRGHWSCGMDQRRDASKLTRQPQLRVRVVFFCGGGGWGGGLHIRAGAGVGSRSLVRKEPACLMLGAD